MNLEPVIKLLETDEISLVKVVACLFPCIYTILYLHFPTFVFLDTLPSLLMTLGVSIILTASFTSYNSIAIKIDLPAKLALHQILGLCSIPFIYGCIWKFSSTILISTFLGGIVALVVLASVEGFKKKRKSNNNEA